jgi:uncharacterized membrane protein YcaP (DUF421 family)
VIVERGKIVQSELRRNRLTLDELIEELRLLGQTDFTKIQYAVLETNGKLSVVRYGEHQPAAAGELAVLAGRDRPASPGLPVTLISDGNWQTKNIRRRGLTPEWVRQKLADLGFSSAKQVFLLTVDECDRLYCQEKQR